MSHRRRPGPAAGDSPGVALVGGSPVDHAEVQLASMRVHAVAFESVSPEYAERRVISRSDERLDRGRARFDDMRDDGGHGFGSNALGPMPGCDAVPDLPDVRVVDRSSREERAYDGLCCVRTKAYRVPLVAPSPRLAYHGTQPPLPVDVRHAKVRVR